MKEQISKLQFIWRTEPPIDIERQKFLSERLTTNVDIQQGIYPFKDVKLTRADIEWLLIMYEQKSVDEGGVDQTQRPGLDLRAADLRRADLRRLPLARICGGLTVDEW